MLDLGATVVSVEPQADLAAAIRETAALNCWSARSTVFNNFACSCSSTTKSCWDKGNKWCVRPRRPYSDVGLWRAEQGQLSLQAAGTLPIVRGVGIDDLIFHGLDNRIDTPHHLDFIKLDGDGPEYLLLESISRLLATFPKLTIDAILVEVQFEPRKPQKLDAFARSFHQLQSQYAFDVYRLDTHDFRRLVTSTGWDAFSPPGTIGALSRVRGALERDALEEELFGVRAMRHLWRIQRDLNQGQWRTILTPMHSRHRTFEFLLVHRRVPLIEARFAWGGLGRVSPEARAAGWNPNASAYRVRGTELWRFRSVPV